VSWLALPANGRLLDPSCGDGKFLACHQRAVGVEIDPAHAARARDRAPGALIHSGEFFTWASKTTERFDAIAGNPPFIRYQNFSGDVRELAMTVAARLGAYFNGLSSSWAPFVVSSAGLLKPGGSMAFVVPAEIGHATYAAPLLDALCRHFQRVGVIAIREKLFPELSEDAWLLYCQGFGGKSPAIHLGICERFTPSSQPPDLKIAVSLDAWRATGCNLRRFLLPRQALALYDELSAHESVSRFGDVAHAGIGYVTGANDFFHLRPSEAKLWNLPKRCLRVAVRRSEQLPDEDVNEPVVRGWLDADDPVLLLDLSGEQGLSEPIHRYLSTADAQRARRTYKCRNRDPWYVVPDVRPPDAFLSYMSGRATALVANSAGCVCTNSVHAVRLKTALPVAKLQRAWRHPLCQLSCELEGHPLGGGMLKLEPGEAAQTRLPLGKLDLTESQSNLVLEAISTMRRWRHYE
jgi:hypothetical protein